MRVLALPFDFAGHEPKVDPNYPGLPFDFAGLGDPWAVPTSILNLDGLGDPWAVPDILDLNGLGPAWDTNTGLPL